MSPRRKRIFALVTVAVIALLLVALEASLRLFGYGSEYELVIPATDHGKSYLCLNPTVGKRYFDESRYFLPKIERTLFEAEKSSETFRVFCLGASTTAGFPYSYNLSPSFILKKQLEIALPGKRVEVINAGLTATSSFTVVEFARELARCKPDVFVIYTGQNEFYGALGAGSTVSIGKYRWLTTTYLALRRLKSFVLFEESLAALTHAVMGHDAPVQSGTLMEQLAKDKAIRFNSPVYVRAMDTYEKNLDAVLSAAADNGIPVVISTLVVNERSLQPFVSLHAEGMSDSETRDVDGLLAQGERLQQHADYAGAVSLYMKAAALDPQYALTQYKLGQCYEQQGVADSALAAYSAARDFDGLRFRASSDANAIVRRAALSSHAVIADVDSAFRAHSPGGMLGSGLLWEHVHPTSDGYFLLSAAWYKAIASIPSVSQQLSGAFRVGIPDSLLHAAVGSTELDEAFGSQTMEKLLHRWPFQSGPARAAAQPQNDIQRAASLFINNTLRWSEAHYELADAMLKRRDLAGALKEYEAVNAYYPDDAFPLTRMADMYALLGLNDKAIAVLLRLLDAGETQFIHCKLGVLYATSATPDRALIHLSRAFELDSQAATHFSQAQFEEATYSYALALFREGRKEEAKETLTMLLQNDPAHAKARALLTTVSKLK